MEPTIMDGSICLFCGGEALAGTRQGRIVLVALRDGVDPETSGRLTVKRYTSQKGVDSSENWRRIRIELQPLNPAYKQMVIEAAEEGTLQVLGEFVRVIS